MCDQTQKEYLSWTKIASIQLHCNTSILALYYKNKEKLGHLKMKKFGFAMQYKRH